MVMPAAAYPSRSSCEAGDGETGHPRPSIRQMGRKIPYKKTLDQYRSSLILSSTTNTWGGNNLSVQVEAMVLISL